MLAVEDLTVTFGRRHQITAVDGFSFEVARGEMVGLLGANGAGKTTTLKVLSTLVRPTSGRARVAGHDVVGSARKVRTSVSTLLEGDRNIYWRLTARQNLEYFAALQGQSRREARPRIEALLDRLNLQDKRDTEARSLSRGMKQKLALACAVVRQTQVLLLDEPTLGLDVDTSLQLRAWLTELAAAGATIVLSSHDMRVVEAICPRVIVMASGALVADDTVGNLVEMFRTAEYRFRVLGAFPAEHASELSARFGATCSPSDQQVVEVRVAVTEPAQFYVLVEQFRRWELEVVSVSRDQPDLEAVYLRLLAPDAVG